MHGLPDAVAAKLDELAAQHAEIAGKLEDPAILADHNAVRELSIKKAALDPVASGYARYRALLDEAAELRASVESGEDPELAEMAAEELPRLEREASEAIEAVKAALVQSDDRRVGSVIMEVRAGAGGDEAGLWARDLLAMYEKYA
ncbi:MAG: PCRF domain-containing protein, partial [Planctomycetota bacterium]